MKKIFLIICLIWICTVVMTNAQPITSAAPRDGVVDRTERVDKNPIAYPWIRNADYIWEKRVWRIIDMREKMNQPMYYPEVPHNNWRSLMTLIMDSFRTTEITAYDATSTTDEFILPFTYKEFLESYNRVDTVMLPSTTPPYDPVPTPVTRTFDLKDVKKIKIKEDWFFDKQRSMLEVRIIGICPIMDMINPDGSVSAKSLFWIYFPEIRPILVKNDVFNRFNGAAKLTYDDFFWKRMFSSYIYKVDNQYDRRISEYASGIDAILESERIKEDLFNFEQQLWEY